MQNPRPQVLRSNLVCYTHKITALKPLGAISRLICTTQAWHRTAIARHFTDCLPTEPVLLGYSASAGKTLTGRWTVLHTYVYIPPHGQQVRQELTGGGVWGYERGRGRGGTFVACENKAHVRQCNILCHVYVCTKTIQHPFFQEKDLLDVRVGWRLGSVERTTANRCIKVGGHQLENMFARHLLVLVVLGSGKESSRMRRELLCQIFLSVFSA